MLDVSVGGCALYILDKWIEDSGQCIAKVGALLLLLLLLLHVGCVCAVQSHPSHQNGIRGGRLN